MKRGQSFAATMDWWVMGIVVLSLFFLVISIPLVIWQSHSGVLSVLVSGVLIYVCISIIDRAFCTSYLLLDDGLHIRARLRHIVIPYRAMQKITHGNVLGLFSVFNQRRFALSRDCLAISLKDMQWGVVTVSPKDKNTFLSLLLSNIDKERSNRVGGMGRRRLK